MKRPMKAKPMTLDSLYEAMRRAPSGVYVDSPLGLVEVDYDTLWNQLCAYARRHECPRTSPRVFRLDRVTSYESARDGVCAYGRVVRLGDES